jgi:hypothetical protein
MYAAMFLRRMAVLLAIGILHGTLIWRGDVLTSYALLGMLLLFFRRLSPRALLAAAAATVVSASLPDQYRDRRHGAEVPGPSARRPGQLDLHAWKLHSDHDPGSTRLSVLVSPLAALRVSGVSYIIRSGDCGPCAWIW